MCFLDALHLYEPFIVFWDVSSILLSRSDENPSQSAFFRLNRLLNVVGCATITGFTLTQIGQCCVWGIGSRTDFSHIFEMYDDANMRSGLYPFFHIALLNDFDSFALCMSDRLFDSAHSSTAYPSLRCIPRDVVAVEVANYNMRHVLLPSGGSRKLTRDIYKCARKLERLDVY